MKWGRVLTCLYALTTSVNALAKLLLTTHKDKLRRVPVSLFLYLLVRIDYIRFRGPGLVKNIQIEIYSEKKIKKELGWK